MSIDTLRSDLCHSAIWINLALLSALQPLAVLTLRVLAVQEIWRTASGILVKSNGSTKLWHCSKMLKDVLSKRNNETQTKKETFCQVSAQIGTPLMDVPQEVVVSKPSKRPRSGPAKWNSS